MKPNVWEKYLPRKKSVATESSGITVHSTSYDLGKLHGRNQAISDCLASLPDGLDEDKVRLMLEAHANKYEYDFNASLIDEICEAYSKGLLFKEREK